MPTRQPSIKSKDALKKENSSYKCIKITSILFLVISFLVVGVFSYFVHKSLLFFPWWRGTVAGSGNPLQKHGLFYEDVEFTAFDTNHTIRGWWIPAASDNDLKTTIIVVHGSGRDRFEWFDQLHVFHEEGLSALVYDSIDGMGISDNEGRGIGYSYREHKDVRAAIRYVKNTYPGASNKLVLTGMSLGAGSVIIAGGKDRDLIDGVIAESPYVHPQLAWKHNIYRYLSDDSLSKLFAFIKPFDKIIPTNPPEWLINLILEYTTHSIISTGHQLSPLDTPDLHVSLIHPKPILFTHSTNDPVCPYIHSQQLYSLAKEPKELWTIDDTHHSTSYRSAGYKAYKSKLNEFLKKI